MEELFEVLFPLVVIVLPLLLRSKNQKKQRPGPKAPEKKPQQREKSLAQTMAEVEKKIDAWMAQIEDSEKPQSMQPEPLVAERLQETGLGEGHSRMDEFGCIGGSMGHAEDGHHQGEDFHSPDVHNAEKRAADAPMQVERVKSAVSAEDLRRAVIWKEILDAPLSMRD